MTVENKVRPTDTAAIPLLPISLWKELPLNAYNGIDSSKLYFKRYRLFALDSLAMQKLLSNAPKEKERDDESRKLVLEIPIPDGGFMKFSIYRTTVMDSALEARYPLLRTFGGLGIDDRTSGIRLDFNSNGFHAYVTGKTGEWLIQPAGKGVTHQYLCCFFKQDAVTPGRQPFELPDSPTR